MEHVISTLENQLPLFSLSSEACLDKAAGIADLVSLVDSLTSEEKTLFFKLIKPDLVDLYRSIVDGTHHSNATRLDLNSLLLDLEQSAADMRMFVELIHAKQASISRLPDAEEQLHILQSIKSKIGSIMCDGSRISIGKRYSHEVSFSKEYAAVSQSIYGRILLDLAHRAALNSFPSEE